MDAQLARLTTLVLAGICGLFVLTALVQLGGYGRGYGWLSPDHPDPQAEELAIDRNPFALPAQTRFSEVEARPLFNEDRKPTPVASAEAVAEDQPQAPLNVSLTGVVIVRKTDTTPELRVAMVRDNTRNETLALKVGMPLTGEQAGWTLASLEPRLAVFRNANDETSEIELQTAAGPAPPPPSARRPGGATSSPAAPGAVAPEQKGNATDSDLARRIEERRRQMREEAERLRRERAGNEPNEQSKQ
ncbi:hypothetical protein [Dokdonella sp.]|uniref:hypothetical protein n=1 Tax=Dokdonella sp. TaxID=2291710 RepID=UPI0025BB31CB|nr:hypothetical protein [Dokdonella sp.]MBX3690806.1 hypothetical protein [Dokdonella sp.]MCW5566607.1 hypothetical protein [Dokdonella sp.]